MKHISRGLFGLFPLLLLSVEVFEFELEFSLFLSVPPLKYRLLQDLGYD